MNSIFNIQCIIGIESVDSRKKEKEGKEYFSTYSYVLFVIFIIIHNCTNGVLSYIQCDESYFDSQGCLWKPELWHG